MNIWVEKFYIPSAMAAHNHGMACIEHGDGIVAAATMYDLDHKPVILLADMQEGNKGCSLTNGAEAAINYVAAQFVVPEGFRIDEAEWIELDSMGCWDVLKPTVTDDGMHCLKVTWAPLRNAGGSRTIGAFQHAFEPCWEMLLGAVTDAAQPYRIFV